MSVLSKGTTFASGNQVTATNLNALVDSATFASGAVDDSTTQLSGGAIIVKDGGITSAKLDTNIAIAGTLGATGTITKTNAAATDVVGIQSATTTTGANAMTFTNTGGTYYIGADNSAGNYITNNAYDFGINVPSGVGISHVINNTTIVRIASTGLTVTGTLGVTGGAWFGSAALATSATTGHMYIPTSNGAPTGVPATKTGQVALQFDTANNKLYVYNSGWVATAALS